MCDTDQIRAELAVLDPLQFPAACRYLQDNLAKGESEIPYEPEYLEVDVPKPIRVTRKILIPVHKAPGFNWVGKLLGRGGEHMKQMSSENKSRVFVFGRGSTKNEQEEIQLLNSGDPEYAHFNECLHVKVETIGAPTVAYERLSNVLKLLKEHVTLKLDEVQQYGGGGRGGGFGSSGGGDWNTTRGGGGGRRGRGGGFRGADVRGLRRPMRGAGMRGRGARGGGAGMGGAMGQAGAGYDSGFEDFGLGGDTNNGYGSYGGGFEGASGDSYGMGPGLGGASAVPPAAVAAMRARGLRRMGRMGGPMRAGRVRARIPGRMAPY